MQSGDAPPTFALVQLGGPGFITRLYLLFRSTNQETV